MSNDEAEVYQFAAPDPLVDSENHKKLLNYLSRNGFNSYYQRYKKAPPQESWYKNLYLNYPNNEITWELTDKLGQIFCPEHRCHGWLNYYLCHVICSEGNTVADLRTIYDNFHAALKWKHIRFEKDVFVQALKDLKELHHIYAIGSVVWHHSLYESEHKIVTQLDDMKATPLEELSDPDTFKEGLTEDQYEILRAVRCHRINILDGLPGTGKTFTCERIVKYLEDNGIPVWLLAPTGLAAKTLGEKCGKPARTLHSFVYKSPEVTGGTVAYLIDEFSMVDTKIFSAFMEKITKDSILILVGDVGQLPSIGPGQLLKELISMKDHYNIAYRRLDKIIRQAAGSDIITNAHKIRHGEQNIKKGSDSFTFLPYDKEEDVSKQLIRFSTTLQEKGRDFIVLSPTHKGPCGGEFLNENLRGIFNPPDITKMEAQKGKWREGDKILVNQNFYHLGLVNGDIGYIKKILDDKQFVITVMGADYSIGKEVIEALRHAYALTIHKSQGQEFDVVVMPFVNSFTIQLQRKLFYTAVTRAKKKVIVLGHESAINRAIATDREQFRRTGLKILAGAKS